MLLPSEKRLDAIENPPKIKKCSKCGFEKLVGCFDKRKKNADGLDGWCRECKKIYRDEYRQNNREAVIAATKNWAAQHPELVKKKYQKNRLKQYGITPEEKQTVFEFQKGLCAICEAPLTRPNVDHDHRTGATRGLLCWRCNSALGKFQDKVERLQRAVEYLTNYPVTLALGSPRFGLPGRVSSSVKHRRKMLKRLAKIQGTPR